MTVLDRYVFRLLMGPFAFFTVVFAALFWLNSALRIISFVVENGQSGGVFLAFSMLLLPQSIQLIIAVAGFASALYLANTLYNNSELVIMMTAGQSPQRVLVPFVAFGLFCAVILSMLNHFITPNATLRIENTREEMRNAFASRLSQEARFLSPTKDVTVYFGTIDQSGGLGDVFIDDRSNEGQRQTYFAETGQFVNQDDELRLLLLDGTTQVLDTASGKLSTLKFESLSYNLSELQDQDRQRRRDMREFTTPRLLSGDTGQGTAREIAEFHQRVSLSLYAFLTPLFGALALFVSGYRRQGYAVNLYVASAVFVVIETARGNMTRLVNNQTIPGEASYLPAAVLAILVVALLLVSRRSHKEQTA
ncbi:MAG: LptF/LptG family permease [Pseudomonadota bacterium]